MKWLEISLPISSFSSHFLALALFFSKLKRNELLPTNPLPQWQVKVKPLYDEEETSDVVSKLRVFILS